MASQEVMQLRQELLVRDQQIFNLRKQNLDLRSKVQCYRRMVAKGQKDENESEDADSRTDVDVQDDFNTMSGAVLNSKNSDDKLERIGATEFVSPQPLRSNGEDLLRNDIHSKTIKLASQMISDQVIPEEDRTQSSAGPNDLANSLIKQFSLIEKGSTPLMRPSLKSKTNFRKATSLYVDTPNKFGTGDKTTLGGMSGMSRQSQVSTLQIESFCTHMQSVSQVLQSKNIRELMANITVAMRRVFKA